jgi:hypothetical protein
MASKKIAIAMSTARGGKASSVLAPSAAIGTAGIE